MTDRLQKRSEIWARIEASRYRGGLPEQGPEDLVHACAHASQKTAFLWETFSHRGDTVPPSRTRNPALHPPKCFHACGTTALVRWRPVDTAPDTYTGLFAEEGVGLLRLSLANTTDTFSPSLALKLFVDGAEPSLNVLAMHRLEGLSLAETEEQGFFGLPLTTHFPEPNPVTTIWDRFPFRTKFYEWIALVGAFEAVLDWHFPVEESGHEGPQPVKTYLNTLRGITGAGATVAHPSRGPDTISFHASRALQQALPRPVGADFRQVLGAADWAPDFPLYDVHDEATHERIGTLHLESGFIASAYGDRTLFFSHPVPPWVELAGPEPAPG